MHEAQKGALRVILKPSFPLFAMLCFSPLLSTAFVHIPSPIRRPSSCLSGIRNSEGNVGELSHSPVLKLPLQDHLRKQISELSLDLTSGSHVFARDIAAPIQRVSDPFLDKCGTELYLKREDLIHAEISGNKWRKLKYNVLQAAAAGNQTVITFGGPFSNHIAATAAAGAACSLRTVGVIRGEEFEGDEENPTLSFARSQGMTLHHISRSQFRQLREEVGSGAAGGLGDGALEEIGTELGAGAAAGGACLVWAEARRARSEARGGGAGFVVPEGGSNALGVCGCAETLLEAGAEAGKFEVLAVACGTGATLAGLGASAAEGQQVVGFSALKGGGFLLDDARRHVAQVLEEAAARRKGAQLQLRTEFHFGGYGKTPPRLIHFLRRFYALCGVRLDPVYTGKMVHGLYDMAEKGELRGKRVLAIHTGGLQGIPGVEKRLREAIF